MFSLFKGSNIHMFQNSTLPKKKHINEFFKRKLSWGGKRGSQIIEHDSPLKYDSNDSKLLVDNNMLKDEIDESIEEAFEESIDLNAQISKEDVEEADHNLTYQNGDIITQEISEYSKTNIEDEIIDIQSTTTPIKSKIKSSKTPKETPKKQNNENIYSDSIVSTPSNDSIKKKKSFLEILGLKKKPIIPHEIYTLNENMSSNSNHKEPKLRRDLPHIEELPYYNGLQSTFKDYISRSKLFFKHSKRLITDFIKPGCKKGIQEFHKLSEHLSYFVSKYKLQFSKAEKSYKEENWQFGKYFYELYCQIEDAIQHYRISQVQLSFNLAKDGGPPSRLEIFLLLNDKQKKELLSFDDLLLTPIHHINSICHITKRLSDITPPSHSEYDSIHRSYKAFNRLAQILVSIDSKESADYEEVRHIQESIEFTLNVPYFSLANGRRNLIYHGNFSILYGNENINYLSIHAFLFDDILMFCKKFNDDIEKVTEDTKDEEEDIEESQNNGTTNKKYSVLAVLNVDRIFIIDPYDGISNLDDESVRAQVETKLEIIDIGACIHRIDFDLIGEKRLWKEHLSFVLSKTTPSYLIFDIPKLYKNLLSDTSEQLCDHSDVWPHYLSLRAIQNNEYIVSPPKRNEIDKIIWQEIVLLKENMTVKIEELEEKVSQFTDHASSSEESLTLINDEELTPSDLQNAFEKERKLRIEAESKVKELTTQIVLLNDEMKKKDEDYLIRFKQFEEELIRQREQHSNDIEKILSLLQVNMVQGKSSITNPIKSRQSSKRMLNHDSNSPTLSHQEDILKPGDDSTESSSKTDSNHQQNSPSNLRMSNKTNHAVKGRVLKQKKFTEDKKYKKHRSTDKSKEKNSPWRRRPTVESYSDLNIRKSKKIEWSDVKGEIYFSDHFTYDQDEFKKNNIHFHSDYPRTERIDTHPMREYNSDYFSEDDNYILKSKLNEIQTNI